MQDSFNKLNPNKVKSGGIELQELFRVLINGKWLITATTSVASVLVVIYSLSLPNIYESKALIFPIEESNANSALRGYGGLASLAGIALPSQGGSMSNSAKAIEKLKSLSFFKENILPNIFLPDLMALESWDSSANSIKYNNEIYDSNTNKWIRKKSGFTDINNTTPTAQESFTVFKGNFSISEDTLTGFITISVKHQSPYIAKQWMELIFIQINQYYRKKDRLIAEVSVDFLQKEMQKTTYAEIKQVLAELLKQETQKLALIEANDAYVFDYIDPPEVMEKKSAPARALICILGAIFGFIVGLLLVLFNHFRLKII